MVDILPDSLENIMDLYRFALRWNVIYRYLVKQCALLAPRMNHRFPLLPVEEEGRLHDQPLCENFIESVCVYRSPGDQLPT